MTLKQYISKHSRPIKIIGSLAVAAGIAAFGYETFNLGYYKHESEQQQTETQTSKSKNYNPVIPKFNTDIAIQRIEKDGKIIEVPLVKAGTKKVPIISDKNQKPRTLDETVAQGNELRAVTGYADVPAYQPYQTNQSQPTQQSQQTDSARKAYEILDSRLSSQIDANFKQFDSIKESLNQINNYIQKPAKESVKESIPEPSQQEPPKSPQPPQPMSLPEQIPAPSTPLAPLTPVHDKNIVSVRRLPDSNGNPYLLVEFQNKNKLNLSQVDPNALSQDVPFIADLPCKDLDKDGIEDLVLTFSDGEQILLSGSYDNNAPVDKFNRPNIFLPRK